MLLNNLDRYDPVDYNWLRENEYLNRQLEEFLDGERVLDKYIIRGMVKFDTSIYGTELLTKVLDKGYHLVTNARGEIVIDITNLDVSHITDLSGTFKELSFNQDIGRWDTSNVKTIEQLFYNCTIFNQNLSSWNVSNVTEMSYLFANCHNFNQPLNNWDISNVLSLYDVFFDARSFNQQLDKWDVSNVRSFGDIFYGATSFNQYLGDWNIRKDSNSPIIDNISFNDYNDIHRFTENRLLFFIDEYKSSDADTIEINKYNLMKYVKNFKQHDLALFNEIFDKIKNELNIDIGLKNG